MGRVGRGGFEFGHVQGVVPIRRRCFSQRRTVSQVDFPVLLETRMQRDAEQPALVEALGELGQPAARVEERLLRLGAVLRQDVYDPDLVRHEQPP